MVASIIVARMLGREGFGEIGIIQSTIGLFGVFAGFGLGATATKYIAEFKRKEPIRAGRITDLTIMVSCITAGIFSLACLLLAPMLAEKTLNRPDLAPLISAAALLLFISAIGGVLQAALSGFESFRAIARINIIQGVVAPFITVPLVWAYGVEGAVAAMTVNAAVALILFAQAVKVERKMFGVAISSLSGIFNEKNILWKFALPSVVSALMVVPASWIANLILVNQPGGYGELGLYTAANQWSIFITFIPGLLSAAMLPIMSETHGSNNSDDFRKAVSLNLRITWVVALPLTVIVIALAEPAATLYGKQFAGVAPILSILMLCVFLNVVNGPVGTALAGAGRMWTGALMNLAWAIALLIAAFMLVPRFGGLGLAMAYLVAYLLHTIWVMTYVEFKLARFAIMTQWQLMLFSMLLLILSIVISSGGRWQYLYHTILILFSVLPIIKMIRGYAMHHNKEVMQ